MRVFSLLFVEQTNHNEGTGEVSLFGVFSTADKARAVALAEMAKRKAEWEEEMGEPDPNFALPTDPNWTYAPFGLALGIDEDGGFRIVETELDSAIESDKAGLL